MKAHYIRTSLQGCSVVVLAAVAGIYPFVAAAQEIQQEQEQEAVEVLEEIVVTGTRVAGRSPTETTSPIDLLGGEELSTQGSFDLTDQLSNISPSFNTQRFPIADGTAFIRPANLRNLPPDQTLVLVNGSRRHRSALVNLQAEPFGTVNQGAQAVDFGIIPSIAIKRVEVLRDGASAQYGSDAIAGVINVILKDNNEGVTLETQYGQRYEGDGENFRFAANAGLPLGDQGFFNASGEFISSQITSRGSARPDAAAVAAVVGAENVPFNGLGQRWGDPDIEGFRLFFNTEFNPTERLTLYGHGSYADQRNRSGFFYRAPVGVPGVDPRATLFVDGDGDGNPDPVDQDIIDDILERGLDPNDYVTADPNSPSGFVALNPIAAQFPGGYNPTFGADITDYAGVVGARGDLDWGLRWDLSGRFAENEVIYVLENSINPGLGITSPTSFRPGQLAQRELGVNADFVYSIDGNLATPINIAFGAEYRRETYEIGIGDPASFEFGPTGILFGVGSDGFQGDSPDAAGTFRRSSYAGYIDVEADLTEEWTLAVAGRIESSRDFDTTFDWKVSSRYQLIDWLAVRGTVNTGFRAPTPGQINTLDVTTTANSAGQLVPQGTFPVNSPAAIALGATPLDAEDAFNITAGIVLTPLPNINLTVDFYRIEVDKRIALANIVITPGSPEQQALIDAGVEGAELLGQVSFFTNGFDTTVKGVEIAAVGEWNVGELGLLTLDLRHSYNDQDVDRVIAGTINDERVFDLENQLPNHRSIFTGNLATPFGIDLRLRVNRYGGWQDSTFGEVASFGSEWLFDAEVAWQINENFRIAAGGENIADNFPDRETNSVLNFLGATRPISSPFGFNGGFWYLRATANF